MKSWHYVLPLLAAFAAAFSGCASAAFSQNGLGPGDTRYTLQSGGRERTYVLHEPSGAGGKKNLPLVIALHGGGGNAMLNAQQTGFNLEADRSGFVVVHANGTGEARPLLNAMGRGFMFTWNAGSCCGYAADNKVDDVAFIRAVVADVKKKYSINSKRIYATGLSNGAMMAYRLACDASDIFAAVGIVSGALTSSCNPSQPVSVIHIHGTADQNVPIAGGVGPKSYDRGAKPPVANAINFWAKADGAAQGKSSSIGNVKKEDFVGKNGAEVVFYLINGGGHSWPGGQRMLATLDAPSQDMNATRTIWEFFAAHPKP